MSKPVPLSPYINGEFVEIPRPDKEFVALNPECPSEIIAITRWKKDLIAPVVEGLSTAYELFRMQSFEERLSFVRLLMSEITHHSDHLRELMMKELARSKSAVDEEWALCQSLFALLPSFCEEALREKVSPGGWTWRYAPVGKIFVSSNVALPVYSLLSSALPALIAGNSVCIRPSIHSPLTGHFFAHILNHLKCPPGLVQVVFGDLETYRQIISTHAFETVHYTGGEESLELIRRDLVKEGKTRMVLCSGGKNAAIVCESADVDRSVREILYGMTADCGQRLEATSLVFVEEAIAEEFTERFVQSVRDIPTGVRLALSTKGHQIMGPLCSENAWERFLRFQSIAARESDETLRWGKSIDNPNNGYYVSPGVHLMGLDRLSSSVYAKNAFFGPDVAIVPVQSFHEAIGGINKMNAARSLSVFSNIQSIAEEVRRESEVPTVLWNSPTTSLDPHLPTFGKGLAGNSHVTGLRFLFSTVYPKTLSLNKTSTAKSLLQAMLMLFGVCFGLALGSEAQADYQKAVEGNEVVKGKLYPKAGKFQINALQAGVILNQSYVSTTLIPVGLTYHINEWHAVSGEFVLGISEDQDARLCVENFFFDPDRASEHARVGLTTCDPNPPPAPNPNVPSTDTSKGERPPYTRKPAYVPIRQIDQMYNLNYQWTPVYGKALWFLSAVGYLDFYTNAGLGLASTTYWPLKEFNSAGNLTRDDGVPANSVREWGEAGRPEPESQMAPTLSLGVGTRFYFAKYVTLNLDFRNTSLVGEDATGSTEFMNIFTLWGGLGVIL